MYWSESFQIQLTVCLCFLSAVCKGKGQVSGRSMPLHFRYGQAARLMSWGDLWPQAHPCSHHGQYLWQQGLRPSLHNLYCHGHVICGSEGRSAPGWGKRMAGRLYSWLLLTWLHHPWAALPLHALSPWHPYLSSSTENMSAVLAPDLALSWRMKTWEVLWGFLWGRACNEY